MLILLLSLLATTCAAVEDYSSYGSRQQPRRVAPHFVPASPPEISPINVNDDIYRNDYWLNPHLIYNFQQVRRDQPSLIEAREESLGKYIGRRSRSTTTTIKPIISTFAPMIKESSSPSTNSYLDHIKQWNDNLNQVPETAPTSASKPQSLEEVLVDEEPTLPKHPSRLPMWNVNQLENIISASTPLVLTNPPSSVSTESSQQNWYHPSTERSAHRVPPVSLAPLISNFPKLALQPSSEPALSSISSTHANPTVSNRQKQKSRNSNRGSYKFNANDLKLSSPEQATSQHSAVNPDKAPPSIPTLTPWYGDNFGK